MKKQEATKQSDTGDLPLLKLSSDEREAFRQVFEAVGTTNKFFVEVGYDGYFDREAASTWTGIFIDKNPPADTQFVHKVKIVKEFVTAENINKILEENGVPEKIDLFAVDMDGNDLHVLRALKATEPRVIITEYNASFGPEHSVTIAYDPAFRRDRMPLYHGASLTAFTKLLGQRGYSLVGVEHYGVNAFFVKTELCKDKLPVLKPAEAWRPNLARSGTWQEHWDKMRGLEFEQI